MLLTAGPLFRLLVTFGVVIVYVVNVLRPYVSAGWRVVEPYGNLVAEFLLLLAASLFEVCKNWLRRISYFPFQAVMIASTRLWVLFWKQDSWNIFLEFLTVVILVILWLLKRFHSSVHQFLMFNLVD